MAIHNKKIRKQQKLDNQFRKAYFIKYGFPGAIQDGKYTEQATRAFAAIRKQTL